MIAEAAVKDRARALGFDLCGIAPAARLPELARFRAWLDRGYAGAMRYLHQSADMRADIRNFLPSARSVIVTATVYYVDPERGDHGAAREGRRSGGIARYAWGEDYHVVLADRLEKLVAWLREAHGEWFDAAIFVDKHHVQERVFAGYAGIGWIGKNTCLINPELGSWLLLAGAAVSLDFAPDRPIADHCGGCTLCLDACPTGALVGPYELDARKCISYLTIELKDAIPDAQRRDVGDHIFGCDVCQDVCPWNLAPLASLDPAWQPREQRDRAAAAELWQRSDHELHALMHGSAMTRTSVARLRRNLAVVLGNSGGRAALDALDRPGRGRARAAPSAATPLVREHVEWARTALDAARRGSPGAPPGDGAPRAEVGTDSA